MPFSRTFQNRLSPEHKLAYLIISRGLQLENASEEQKDDYRRLLDQVEKSAIQSGTLNLVALVGIFRKKVRYSIGVTEANIPEPYKSLMSLAVPSIESELGKKSRFSNISKQLRKQAEQPAEQVMRTSRMAGNSTTNPPPPKPKKKQTSKKDK